MEKKYSVSTRDERVADFQEGLNMSGGKILQLAFYFFTQIHQGLSLDSNVINLWIVYMALK